MTRETQWDRDERRRYHEARHDLLLYDAAVAVVRARDDGADVYDAADEVEALAQAVTEWQTKAHYARQAIANYEQRQRGKADAEVEASQRMDQLVADASDRCQVQVMSGGRAPTFYRCSHKARFRLPDDATAWMDEPIGGLLVCGQHARLWSRRPRDINRWRERDILGRIRR